MTTLQANPPIQLDGHTEMRFENAADKAVNAYIRRAHPEVKPGGKADFDRATVQDMATLTAMGQSELGLTDQLDVTAALGTPARPASPLEALKMLVAHTRNKIR